MKWCRAGFVIGALLGVTPGCGGPAASPAPSVNASESAGGTAPVATSPTRLNIEEIFPPGEGRTLVLDNCQTCHSYVPILVLQMEKEAWQRWANEHRERVANLSDAEFAAALTYLSANFGPHRPVPELPPELLESWTAY